MGCEKRSLREGLKASLKSGLKGAHGADVAGPMAGLALAALFHRQSEPQYAPSSSSLENGSQGATEKQLSHPGGGQPHFRCARIETVPKLFLVRS
jgi:hypothetical protein